MGWGASLAFTAAGFGLASVLVIFLCDYFSVERSEMRLIRRVRRKRRAANIYLRSTAKRDPYQEFEGARKL